MRTEGSGFWCRGGVNLISAISHCKIGPSSDLRHSPGGFHWADRSFRAGTSDM